MGTSIYCRSAQENGKKTKKKKKKQIRLVYRRMQVQTLASLSGLRIKRCHELCVGRRRSSDSALLWLWYWPAAIALIRLLAWEPPYAAGAAQEKAKRQKTKNKNTRAHNQIYFRTNIKETNPTSI